MRPLSLSLVLLGCATTAPSSPSPGPSAPPPARAASCPAAPVGAATFDPERLAAATIEKVCLLGAGDETRLRLYDVVVPSEGTPLDPKTVRDLLAELYRTGLISEARALAEPSPQGAVLTFVVVERPLVSRVVVESAPSLPHDVRLGLEVRSLRDTPAQRTKLLDTAMGFYDDAGFARAEIAFERRPDSANGLELVMKVREGPRLVVKTVRFEGAKKLLAKDLGQGLGTTPGVPVRPGLVEKDALTLSSRYLDRGMVMVTVSSKLEEPSDDGLVDVVFTISEGEVFTLGVVSTKGLSLPVDVLKGLEGKRGAVFSRSMVQRDIERVRARAAKKLGHDVDVTPLTTIDSKANVIDLALEVTEKSAHE